MAGNTKFLGFGAGNKVTLERWGEQAIVELPGPAMEVLREACYKTLPKEPKDPVSHGSVSFNEQTGRIDILITPEEAKLFIDIIERPDHAEMDYPAVALLEVLKRALMTQKAYYDTQGEPGVD